MLAPNVITYQVADATHAERLAHADRIRLVARDRHPDAVRFDRDAQRAITARRLALGAAATLLAMALAVGGAANATQAGNAHGGGGPILLR